MTNMPSPLCQPLLYPPPAQPNPEPHRTKPTAPRQAKKIRDRAAVVDLFNLLVGMEEPADLTADDVKAVGDKYGISMRKDQLEGLQQIFGQYLENVIPTGDQQLRWVGGSRGAASTGGLHAGCMRLHAGCMRLHRVARAADLQSSGPASSLCHPPPQPDPSLP